MVDLHYRFSLALDSIAMDEDQFSFAVCMDLLFTQLSLQVGHSLNKLSLGECRQNEFVGGVDIMVGSILVHYYRLKSFLRM